MNIKDAIISYQNNGYSYADAESKVSQDIVLSLIGESKYNRHITVKGGVVMHIISNNIRRATRDLDVDNNFPKTRNMFLKRKKTYEKMGYEIIE